jgi:hypothetical protein
MTQNIETAKINAALDLLRELRRELRKNVRQCGIRLYIG